MSRGEDSISKVDLIDFVRKFQLVWGFDKNEDCVWTVSTFATELERWLEYKNMANRRITVKRLGLTVGSIDIKGSALPSDAELMLIVFRTFPSFDASMDTYELNDI